MQDELRTRVIKIKEQEGISFKHICKIIGYCDESYFCRWRQAKQGYNLSEEQLNNLDKFLLLKGY